MAAEEAPTSGWFCTSADANFAMHLVEAPGRRPIIYRIALDNQLPGIVVRRHDGTEIQDIALRAGSPHRVARGLWLTASLNSRRVICIHADPAVRTSRRWHYHLQPQEDQ